MNDVRDEALGALLDREATRIESSPIDRLPDVLRWGSRKRALRFTAIAAGVAVFAGAVSWAGLQNEGSETIPANIADWDTFASLENNGWTVRVPPPWLVQELPACPNAPERIGLSVTNTDFVFRDPRGGMPSCGERHVFAGFPQDGVVFQFQPWGDWGLLRPQPDTPFPLSAELLQLSGGIKGGPTESNAAVSVDGRIFGIVRRYVGSEASRKDIAALDRMLASLRVRGAIEWVDASNSSTQLQVTVAHPEGWEVTRFRGITVIDAPQPILMVTSPGVREGYSRCLGGPFEEFRSLGRFGVVVVISDATGSWGAGSISRPRPPALRPSEARYDDVVRCSGEVRRLTFQFNEAGRPISVYVLVSTAYEREQPEILWHVLDSIEIVGR